MLTGFKWLGMSPNSWNEEHLTRLCTHGFSSSVFEAVGQMKGAHLNACQPLFVQCISLILHVTFLYLLQVTHETKTETYVYLKEGKKKCVYLFDILKLNDIFVCSLNCDVSPCCTQVAQT